MQDAESSEGDEDVQPGEASQAHIGDEEGDDDSLQAFEGHGDAVLAVAWSPTQPDLVATGGQDDKAYLWRVRMRTRTRQQGAIATFAVPRCSSERPARLSLHCS
jgi:WD40 repeat protein